MKITSPDQLGFGVVDKIIPEPEGGAHRDHERAAAILKEHLIEAYDELKDLTVDDLLERRYEKFRKIGEFKEGE